MAAVSVVDAFRRDRVGIVSFCVVAFCGRMLVMRDGEAPEEGPTEHLLRTPARPCASTRA
ncbi:hypothetical protein [Streptomyces sp. NPDC015130]|uniref:hypothetical protein n=1 Tax=Streptomyces sp. NPDC015130 TaxID=3364940 RepID=UPI0036F84015